jgi:NAD/NADP transhydrogenase alpha subunit
MYSRNMEKLALLRHEGRRWKLDFKDEIVAGSVITHAGRGSSTPR